MHQLPLLVQTLVQAAPGGQPSYNTLIYVAGVHGHVAAAVPAPSVSHAAQTRSNRRAALSASYLSRRTAPSDRSGGEGLTGIHSTAEQVVDFM